MVLFILTCYRLHCCVPYGLVVVVDSVFIEGFRSNLSELRMNIITHDEGCTNLTEICAFRTINVSVLYRVCLEFDQLKLLSAF